MFAVVARGVPRRAVAHSVRCMAKKSSPLSKAASTSAPPPPPPPASKPPPAQPKSTAPDVPPAPVESAKPFAAGGLPSLDFSPPEPSEKQQTTGARSSKGSLSSAERQRRFVGRVVLAMLTAGLVVNTIHMGREWDEEELKMKKMVRFLFCRTEVLLHFTCT